MQSVADARLPLGSSVTEEERGRVLVPVSASRAVSGELPGLQTGPSHRVRAWWKACRFSALLLGSRWSVGPEPSPMTAFDLNYLRKGPISRDSHTGGWGFNMWILGRSIQSIIVHQLGFSVELTCSGVRPRILVSFASWHMELHSYRLYRPVINNSIYCISRSPCVLDWKKVEVLHYIYVSVVVKSICQILYFEEIYGVFGANLSKSFYFVIFQKCPSCSSVFFLMNIQLSHYFNLVDKNRMQTVL